MCGLEYVVLTFKLIIISQDVVMDLEEQEELFTRFQNSRLKTFLDLKTLRMYFQDKF